MLNITVELICIKDFSALLYVVIHLARSACGGVPNHNLSVLLIEFSIKAERYKLVPELVRSEARNIPC